MDKLLENISKDLDVYPYIGESTNHYTSRLILSALSLWMLHYAKDKNFFGEKNDYVSKAFLTRNGNILINKFIELYPESLYYFEKENTIQELRFMYEINGYFLANKNKLKLSDFERKIGLGNKALYFGVPEKVSRMNGIGVIVDDTDNSSDFESLLINNQKAEDIITVIINRGTKNYTKCTDLDFNEYEKFNPFSKEAFSNAWEYKINSEYTIAKYNKTEYVFLIKKDGELFYNFLPEIYGKKPNDSIYSREYRRLLFGLKSYYGNSEKVELKKLDNQYFKLRLKSHLPKYETSLLLLLGWPSRNSQDYGEFIMRRSSKEALIKILELLNLQWEEN